MSGEHKFKDQKDQDQQVQRSARTQDHSKIKISKRTIRKIKISKRKSLWQGRAPLIVFADKVGDHGAEDADLIVGHRGADIAHRQLVRDPAVLAEDCLDLLRDRCLLQGLAVEAIDRAVAFFATGLVRQADSSND